MRCASRIDRIESGARSHAERKVLLTALILENKPVGNCAMKLWSRYQVARSVDEVIALLTQYAGHAQIIAGGTDLLLDIQQGNHPPADTLIDITRVPELTSIEITDTHLILGAAVTHTAIVDHPVIRARSTCLAESCGVVGGPQVRNVATIGGNVVHGLPAADGTLSLVALSAEAEVASTKGRRWYPVSELFLGPGKSIVDPSNHLLTRFKLALSEGHEGSAFKRIMRPQGVALPILGCAARVKLDAAHSKFEEVALCLGPVGPTPTRAESVESLLVGSLANDDTIQQAALYARQNLHPRTSKYRATSEYRVEMIELLVRESLQLAITRARTGEAVGIG
jgi:CO/xanthine dehydrogenase FAD-binding subunit